MVAKAPWTRHRNQTGILLRAKEISAILTGACWPPGKTALYRSVQKGHRVHFRAVIGLCVDQQLLCCIGETSLTPFAPSI